MFTDISLGVAVQSSVRAQLTEGNKDVFLYCLTHFNKASNHFIKCFWPHNGSSHCNELVYLFRTFVALRFRLTEEDEEVGRLFTNYVANFCRHGDPNGRKDKEKLEKMHSLPPWPPADLQNPRRCLLLQPRPRVDLDFLDGRPDVWLQQDCEKVDP